MQEPPPYSTTVEARKTLKNSNLPDEIKQKIEEFEADLKMEGLSDLRRRDYIYRLKKVAEIIPTSFFNPSKNDMKKVMTKLNSSDYSEWTVVTYITMIKRFYKWLLGDNDYYPDVVKWIKLPNKPNQKVKPDSLVTSEEINLLVSNSMNARDRAIFSTLYDSGIRIGELIGMKIDDLGFDEYGALLRVTGKTGFRQVRVVGNSIAYLRAWLDNHPDRNDTTAPLFCNLSASVKGRQLTYDDIHSIFSKTVKRSGIKRRIYPHLFRHTRATILANKVTEAPLESQMGWVHGSRQTRTYVHLSLRDQDNAILKAYGVQVKDDDTIKEERPKECQRCHQMNPSDATYCRNCWMPFSIEKAVEFQEKEKEIESAIENSKVIPSLVKELIKSAPEGGKVKQLKILLESILKDPELAKAFEDEIRNKDH